MWDPLGDGSLGVGNKRGELMMTGGIRVVMGGSVKAR